MDLSDFEERLSIVLAQRPEDITKADEEILYMEWGHCKDSFTRFLRYAQIIQAPSPGQPGGGLIPFTLAPHIKKIIKTLLTERFISVLKARQIWISTIMSIYVLWYALFHKGANILLFSKGKLESQELLGKSKRVYNELPEFLKLKTGSESKEELSFPTMSSVIHALPSTETAGIGFTGSIVFCDEHAEHEYAVKNYTHVKPTIDRSGQFISVFTENPFDRNNLATELFTDAMEGNNTFVPLFFPYDVVPGRDDKWYEETARNVPQSQLDGLSPELYMWKNYPRSIEEALSTPKTVAVFDKNAIANMKEDARGHINIGWEDIDCDICHIYRDYHIGNKYIAASDVGHGVLGDFSVLTIMDVKSGDVVADILRNDLSPDVFTYHCVQLLRHFGSPLWWIEHNITGGGRDVIKKAVELGYRKLGYRGDKPLIWSQLDNNDMLRRVGYFTDEKGRNDLFGSLIPAVNDYQIKIYNQAGLGHLEHMIRNAKKNGRIEGQTGYHDDYTIAVGICWLKRNDVSTGGKVKAIETLTFRKKEQTMYDRAAEISRNRAVVY